jgi:hypothetical protein
VAEPGGAAAGRAGHAAAQRPPRARGHSTAHSSACGLWPVACVLCCGDAAAGRHRCRCGHAAALLAALRALCAARDQRRRGACSGRCWQVGGTVAEEGSTQARLLVRQRVRNAAWGRLRIPRGRRGPGGPQLRGHRPELHTLRGAAAVHMAQPTEGGLQPGTGRHL